MNQKELNEIRRRFKPDNNTITKIYGCYVGSNKEIISYIDTALYQMTEEEQEMYLGLLKKSLGGALGRNLMDIGFSSSMVESGEEHKLLQALRKSNLSDSKAREQLYHRFIDAMHMEDVNYLILLAADTYDVPARGSEGNYVEDGSDSVFQYFVCSVCPVKEPKLELKYKTEETLFRSASTGHIAVAPIMGFLFPAFDDRATNIYNALFYSKNTADDHQEVIESVFGTEPPMCAFAQKVVFGNAMGESLEDDCSYDVVQSVHEQLRSRILEHKESKDPEPLRLTVEEVGDVLATGGVPSGKVEAFCEECSKQYGEGAELNPKNIIDSNKFCIETPEAKISLSPENSYLVESRVIDGRAYLLIPAGGGVEVNGIAVTLPGQDGPLVDEDSLPFFPKPEEIKKKLGEANEEESE